MNLLRSGGTAVPVAPHCSTRDPGGGVKSRSKGWRWVGLGVGLGIRRWRWVGLGVGLGIRGWRFEIRWVPFLLDNDLQA